MTSTVPTKQPQKQRSRQVHIGLQHSLLCAFSLSLLSFGGLVAQAQEPLNPEIKVGIVQRFGEETNAKLTLTPLTGDQLTLQFETGGQPQTLTANQVVLEIGTEALPQPYLQEWIVLSTHRSFESAEDSANQWKAVGIETEIAQPNAWQVWGKRDVYNTPLLKRLLLQNLQEAGHTNTYIDSQVITEIPKAAFIANGYRYNRDQFNILSANRRIQVTQGTNGRKRLYAGDLRIQPNAYGNYTLVNQVPIELYLRGVVPHEIGPSAPQTATQAQTVLARTYALRNLRRFAIDDYELCADTQCQVYRGLSGTVPSADSAISTTRGQVLTYNNELIDALYSSTSGGISARFSDVWNGPNRPYLRPVIDSVQTTWDLALRPLSNETNFRAFINLKQGFNEIDWPTFRWERSGTLAEITEGVKAYLTNRNHPLANLTQVTHLEITERSETGRVQAITVTTDVGSFDLHKNEVVSALIPPRSQLFYLEPLYEEQTTTTNPNSSPTAESTSPSPTPDPVLKGYTFVGGGFGHGVGMSQTGSYNLGRLGWSYDRILQFYYPGAELKPITHDLTFWTPIAPPTPRVENSAPAEPEPTPQAESSSPDTDVEIPTAPTPPEDTEKTGIDFTLN